MTNAEAILLCVDQGLIAFPVKTPPASHVRAST